MMNSFVRVRNGLRGSNIISKSSFKLPEKYKGGRIEKYVDYWKSVLDDYKSVGSEALQDIKARKVRSAFIFGGLGIIGYALKTNPGMDVFDDTLLQSNCDLGLVGSAVRNKSSEDYIRYIWHEKNTETLKIINLLFFSLMWVDNHSESCQLYETQCKYMQPTYLDIYSRIIDVGLFGSWMVIKHRMKDYDVNGD